MVLKLLENIRCLFRNVNRFQKLIFFVLVEKFSELMHHIISVGSRHSEVLGLLSDCWARFQMG